MERTHGASYRGVNRAFQDQIAARASASALAPKVISNPGVEGFDVHSQPIPFVTLVLELLARAAAALDTDRAMARHCITRASSLLETNLRARNDRSATAFARGGLAAWQVRRLTEHIDATLSSAVEINDCAAIARLSTSHFARAFKVSFGMTFAEYLRQRRIQHAQEMMLTTDKPLRYVARCCGFADQSHFSRIFRRVVGSTPATWRRLYDGHAHTAS